MSNYFYLTCQYLRPITSDKFLNKPFSPIDRYNSESTCRDALQETSQALSLQMLECEERATKAEAHARIERDWRTSLQEKETQHKELIATLQLNNTKLSDDLRVSIKSTNHIH